MDEDDDFFDVTGRFRVSEKRKRQRDSNDEEDSNPTSRKVTLLAELIVLESEDDTSDIAIPDETELLTVYELTNHRRFKEIRQGFMSDEENGDNGVSDYDEVEEIKASTTKKRRITLTPPPTVGQEALRQAMAVINEHVGNDRFGSNARSDNVVTKPLRTTTPPDESDDDDFLAQYKESMNSDIARQAAQYQRTGERLARETTKEEKILLILKGRKKKKQDSVPTDWEKPIGLRVNSTTSFNKMHDEFLKNKKFSGEVVMVWKGVRLRHGTPKDIGMKEKDEIGKHVIGKKCLMN